MAVCELHTEPVGVEVIGDVCIRDGVLPWEQSLL
jgi:hypothetical protein